MTAMTIEQISPELVLVDPELAQLVRAEPRGYGPVIPHISQHHVAEAARPAVARSTRWSPSGWTWLSAATLVILIGVTVLSEWPPPGSRPVLMDIAPAPTAPAVTTTLAAAPSQAISQGFSPPQIARPAGNVPTARSKPAVSAPTPRASPGGNSAAQVERLRLSVEHRLLDLLPSEAGRTVSRAIVDPRSGMLRNNVGVRCRATATPRKLSCSVFAPSGRRVAVLSARVLANGRMIVGR
jgi:hypothetical protein